VADRETLNRLMAGKRWADTSQFIVRRGNERLTLIARFVRPTSPVQPAPAAPR
jgi:hypothetical protein